MRFLPHVLLAIGMLGLIFAYWGIYTSSGRRQFDEMAGMIPFGVGLLGGLFTLTGLAWLLLRLRS